MKILIIDDSRSVAEVIDLMLNDPTANIIWACNGEEGISQLKSDQSIELIFLDWYMPVMDGADFLKKLSELPHEIPPIILMSIDNLEKIQSQIQHVNIAGKLSKPFNKRQLLALVNNFRSSSNK
ncbi:MAG: response regulator [Oligoflexia bacterium]|nr:response regulator [Oligoflexia bacterium]MBF0366540.1 response regulator [Oligoflexia bacterium]